MGQPVHSFKLFKSLRSGKHLDNSDVRNYVIEFHARYPGITESLVVDVTSEDGGTSYETLLDAVRPLGRASVLDLASGSGWLARLLLDAVNLSGKVIGIDISTYALTLAPKRFSEPNVYFVTASAQNIPLLDSSLDIVLCHLGLMVMRPLDPVINEVHRVLKQGGVFAFTIEGLGPHPPLYEAFADLLNELIVSEVPELRAGLCDPRLRSFQSLLDLLRNRFGEEVYRKDFSLVFHGAPDVVIDRLTRFFYSSYLLSVESQARLYEHAYEFLGKHATVEGKLVVHVLQTMIVAHNIIIHK